jgi:hypothetical protein
MKRALLFALATSLLVACGGNKEEEKEDAGPADAGKIDAGVDAGVEDAGMDAGIEDAGTDAGTPPSCTVPATFGDVGALQGAGVTDSATAPTAEFLEAVLDQDTSTNTADLLELELYKVENGIFASGITTGTFPLTGPELNYSTCSLCVLIYGDVNVSSGEPTNFFMATGGSVTLSAVNGSIAGTLSNVTFEEVTIAGEEEGFLSTPVENGCTTSITAGSFSGTLTVQGAAK